MYKPRSWSEPYNDDMTIVNYGFKFQNATHADTKGIWGMASQSSSAAKVGQFCYGINNRKIKVNIKVLSIDNKNKFN